MLLTYIFQLDSAWMAVLVTAFMLLAAAWIALFATEKKRVKNLRFALFALLFGCVPVLLIVTKGVLDLEPWYKLKYFIPLAGMIFSNAMNAVSLAAERFETERKHKVDKDIAVHNSFQAALIPTINSFMSVGLVALPGMMTGQILAGVDPLVAVRYQIVVLAMVLGASGISAALYLWGITRQI